MEGRASSFSLTGRATSPITIRSNTIRPSTVDSDESESPPPKYCTFHMSPFPDASGPINAELCNFKAGKEI